MTGGRTTRRAVAALAASVLLVGACSEASEPSGLQRRATSDPRPQASSGQRRGAPAEGHGFPDSWRPAELDWRDCDLAPGVQCASLEVPLDWQDPLGPTIRLALGRTRATGDRIGSLLSNPGGPGGSGLEHLASRPFGPPVDERFDVVSWDPRGVGASTTVRCGGDVSRFQSIDPDPDDPAEQTELEAAAASIAQECGEIDGELLPHLGAADVARDMEAIRRALGDERLNYVGFSYGTYLGQVYAELFPERIRTMVLDAVVDPSLGYEEMLVEQAAAFDAAFDRGAAACRRAGPAVCGVEDLDAAYDEVLRRVESAPLGSGPSEAGPSELITGAIMTSYVEDGWQVLGPALADALDGDGSYLRELADTYWDFGGFTAYAAVVCIDSPPPRGVERYREFAARAEAAAPRFGAAVANELLSCATWPAPPVARPRAITAQGAPPILVVGNTGDPATPYDNAVAVADRLESATLVTVELEGHTAYGSDRCVTDLVDEYLVDLAVPPAGTRCG